MSFFFLFFFFYPVSHHKVIDKQNVKRGLDESQTGNMSKPVRSITSLKNVTLAPQTVAKKNPTTPSYRCNSRDGGWRQGEKRGWDSGM